MPDYPSVDDSFARLHAAGWSIGDTQTLSAKGLVWLVTGYDGKNVIEARGVTQSEAWYCAVQLAKMVGIPSVHRGSL
jgi:hypothetical protein